MRSTSSLIVVGALGMLGFWGAASFGQDADEQLNAFFKQYLEESFRQRPLEATRLGDHRFDHLLDDISEKGRAAWIEHDRNTLADLPRRVDFPCCSSLLVDMPSPTTPAKRIGSSSTFLRFVPAFPQSR